MEVRKLAYESAVMFNLTFPDTLKETNEPVQTGFSAP
jgi:hypothetical protein